MLHPPNLEEHEISWRINDVTVRDKNLYNTVSTFTNSDTTSNHSITYTIPDTAVSGDIFNISFVCRNILEECSIKAITKPKVPINVQCSRLEYLPDLKKAKVKVNWEMIENKDIIGYSVEFRTRKENDTYSPWLKCGLGGYIKDVSYTADVPYDPKIPQATEVAFRVQSHNQGGSSHQSEPSNLLKLIKPITVTDSLPEMIHISALDNIKHVEVQMTRPIDPESDSLPVWKIENQTFQAEVSDPTTIKFTFTNNMLMGDRKISFPSTLSLISVDDKILTKTMVVKELPTFLTRLPDQLEVNSGERATFMVETNAACEVIWKIKGIN